MLEMTQSNQNLSPDELFFFAKKPNLIPVYEKLRSMLLKSYMVGLVM